MTKKIYEMDTELEGTKSISIFMKNKELIPTKTYLIDYTSQLEFWEDRLFDLFPRFSKEYVTSSLHACIEASITCYNSNGRLDDLACDIFSDEVIAYKEHWNLDLFVSPNDFYDRLAGTIKQIFDFIINVISPTKSEMFLEIEGWYVINNKFKLKINRYDLNDSLLSIMEGF